MTLHLRTIPKPMLPLGLALLLIAAAGCGSSAKDSTAPPTDTADTTTTSAAIDEPTTMAAETSGSPATAGPPAGEAIVVTFDGNECSVDNPAAVAGGDGTFVFTNDSDLAVRMKVLVLNDDVTYQDLLAIETDSGGPGNHWSGPPGTPEALISFTPVELELAENQTALRYALNAGPHAVLAFSPASPFPLWLCGPLTVIDG